MVMPADNHAYEYVVTKAYRVAIDGTSRFLTALTNDTGAAIIFPDDLVRLALIPESGTTGAVHFKIGGDASASTPEWIASGIDMPLSKAVADTIKVIASTGTIYAALFVMTPRN